MPNLMNNLGSWCWRCDARGGGISFFIFQRLKGGSDFPVSLVWSSMLGGRWPWWHFMMKPCISGMVSMSPGLGLLNYWIIGFPVKLVHQKVTWAFDAFQNLPEAGPWQVTNCDAGRLGNDQETVEPRREWTEWTRISRDTAQQKLISLRIRDSGTAGSICVYKYIYILLV